MTMIKQLIRGFIPSSVVMDEEIYLVSKPTISGYNVAIADSDITLVASGSKSAFETATIDYYEWTLPNNSIYQGDILNYHIPAEADIDDVFVFVCIGVDTLGNRSKRVFKGIKIVEVLQFPSIDSLVWNDENHYENNSYELTINATDPQDQDFTYEVICDDPNVTIIQDGINDYIFHVTYPEYTEDMTVTYTIIVTNEDYLDDIGINKKLVSDIMPTGDRGIFGGGYNGPYLNTIDYVTIFNPGNALDFGDLTVSRRYLAACSNGVNDRGIFGGGHSSSPLDIIDYITISTPGNALDFGDLTAVKYYLAATSNGTNDKGVFGGGYNGIVLDIIEYVTISTPGDALDFGDLTVARYYLSATSNGINNRGVFGGGASGQKILDYITISTPGNALDFGDLTVARYYLSATSNGTNDRGVFGGGFNGSYLNTIEYVTISTIGNAADFGDLTVNRYALAACSNGINNRGIFGGGYDSNNSNTIDYITISNIGNAADFGDLSVARQLLAACSDG